MKPQVLGSQISVPLVKLFYMSGAEEQSLWDDLKSLLGMLSGDLDEGELFLWVDENWRVV